MTTPAAQIWVAIAENGSEPPEVIAASLRRDALLMDNPEYRRRFEDWAATTRASEPYEADVQVVPLID
jgi:hypothetical protein